jgi:helix-turn-helix protein
LIESNQLDEETKQALTHLYHSLNPAELKRRIDAKLKTTWSHLSA